MYRLIKKVLKKGINLVVVDVRNTSLAQKADIFLQINPGMDHLLVMLVLKEILKRRKEDTKFLNKYVKLEEPISNLIDEFQTDQVFSEIGISKTDFREFVDLLVKYKHHTIFDIGYGPQKRLQGGKIIRTIALIQVILGNLGKPGTGIIYSQSDFTIPLKNKLIKHISGSFEESKVNTIEIIDLASELKSQTYKVLFIYNFNPVSSLPNQNLLRSVLRQSGLFTVVIDMFLNETTKFADVVIPAKFSLEQNDIFFPFYIPSLSITEGGGCPYSQCVSNYEFFQRLAHDLKLNKNDQFTPSQEDLFFSCLRLLPDHIRKDLNKQGYHLLFKEGEVPYNDLHFPTSDQKIHIPLNSLNFQTFEQKRLSKLGARELFLVSPSHRSFLHSQLGPIQGEHLKEFNKIFLSLMDIVNLEINVGDLVEVSNERGSAKYEVDEMRSLKKGVALIYKGQVSKVNETKPNVNIFTPSQKEKLGHSGSYFSTIIKISK
jgi:anaerobic selenocysteine-containing dehydrogenase